MVDCSPLSHPALLAPCPSARRPNTHRPPGRVSLPSLPASPRDRKLSRCPIYRSLSVTERPVGLEESVAPEVEEVCMEQEGGGDGALWTVPLREVVRAMAWDPNTGVLWLRMDDSKGRDPLLRISSCGMTLGRVGRGLIKYPGQWTYGLCVDVRRSHVLITDGPAIRSIDSNHEITRELTFPGASDLWRVDHAAEDDVYVVIERAGSRGAREKICVLCAETGEVRAHFSVPGDAPMLCSRFLGLSCGMVRIVDQFSYCLKEMSLSGELLAERDIRTMPDFSRFTGMCLDREGRAVVSTVGEGVARFWEEDQQQGSRWERLLQPRHLQSRHLISVCLAQESQSSSHDKIFVITNGESPKYKISCHWYKCHE